MGCKYKEIPSTWLSLGCKRLIMSMTLTPRSASGLSVSVTRPVFKVALAPSTPIKEETLSMAGSSRITLLSACWRSDMAAKEMV